jgi:hypothetical protein
MCRITEKVKDIEKNTIKHIVYSNEHDRSLITPPPKKKRMLIHNTKKQTALPSCTAAKKWEELQNFLKPRM